MAVDRTPPSASSSNLTLADDRWRHRRREIARAREIVCDFLVGDNDAGSTAESLDAYFLPFAVAARGRLSFTPEPPNALASRDAQA